MLDEAEIEIENETRGKENPSPSRDDVKTPTRPIKLDAFSLVVFVFRKSERTLLGRPRPRGATAGVGDLKSVIQRLS